MDKAIPSYGIDPSSILGKGLGLSDLSVRQTHLEDTRMESRQFAKLLRPVWDLSVRVRHLPLGIAWSLLHAA
jgi:hypothetical protein